MCPAEMAFVPGILCANHALVIEDEGLDPGQRILARANMIDIRRPGNREFIGGAHGATVAITGAVRWACCKAAFQSRLTGCFLLCFHAICFCRRGFRGVTEPGHLATYRQ
jgi:hypothetical protein